MKKRNSQRHSQLPEKRTSAEISPTRSLEAVRTVNTEQINKNDISTTPTTAGIYSTAFNLINSMLGIAALSMAQTTADTGILASIVGVGVFCVSVHFTFLLLLESALFTNVHSYEQLAQQILGDFGYIGVCLVCWMINMGTAVAYILFIHDTLDAEISAFMNLNVFTIVLCTSFCLPLCFVKDWEYLAIISKTKSMLYLIVVLFVIIRGNTDPYVSEHVAGSIPFSEFIAQPRTWLNLRAVFKSSSIAVFAFGSIFHDCAFPAHRSMADQSIDAWKKSSKFTLVLLFLVNVTLGIAGALNFRIRHLPHNIFTSKANQRLFSDDSWFLSVRCLFVLLLLLTVPICIHVSREYAQSIITLLQLYSNNHQNNEGENNMAMTAADVAAANHSHTEEHKSGETNNGQESDNDNQHDKSCQSSSNAGKNSSGNGTNTNTNHNETHQVKKASAGVGGSNSIFKMSLLEYSLSCSFFGAVLLIAVLIGDGQILNVVDIIGSYGMITIGLILPPIIYMNTFSLTQLWKNLIDCIASAEKSLKTKAIAFLEFSALWVCILCGISIWIQKTICMFTL